MMLSDNCVFDVNWYEIKDEAGHNVNIPAGSIVTSTGIIFVPPAGGTLSIDPEDKTITFPEGTKVYVYTPPCVLVSDSGSGQYDPTLPGLELDDGTTILIPADDGDYDDLPTGGICVDGNRGKDTNSGADWYHPKKTIQAAIDVATAGQTIYVTPGTYDSFVIADNRGISIVSTGSGADVTILDGKGLTRCATLGTPNLSDVAVDSTFVPSVIANKLTGFTLRNGFSKVGDGQIGNTATVALGAGALCGTLSNCTIATSLPKTVAPAHCMALRSLTRM